MMFEPLPGGTPFAFLLLTAVSASVSITIATLGSAKWITRLYSKTIGGRATQERKIKRLACGVRSDYVDDVLGKPMMTTITTSDEAADLTENLYFLPDAFVMTYCVEHKVQAFVITVHGELFAPKLPLPWGAGPRLPEIQLGRTTYVEILQGQAGEAHCWAGNVHWAYYEVHWMGNVGFYQTYIVGSNRVSPVGWPLVPELPVPEDWTTDDTIDQDDPPSTWAAFRESGAPNTYAVVAEGFDWNSLPSIGPVWTTVRVLPEWRARP